MGKRVVTAEKAPKAVGPYSHAVVAGDFIYTSGQIGCVPGSNCIAVGGIREQAKQVFENLRAVLEASGADFSNVIKATVFLCDMNDFTAVNEVYASFFDGEFPARSCVQVARLPRDVDVEIEMVAYIGQ